MKEIKPIGNNLYWIESEPGDATRYSYFVYHDYADFSFMPKNNDFRYPQKLNYYDVKNLNDDGSLYRFAEKEYCNPWTLKECIRTIMELHNA